MLKNFKDNIIKIKEHLINKQKEKKIEDEIVLKITRNAEITEYFSKVNKEIISKALVKGIGKLISQNYPIYQYLKFLQEKEKSEIKEKYQNQIKKRVIERILNNNEIAEYVDFLNEKSTNEIKEKFKEKIRINIIKRIEEGLSIKEYQKIVENEIFENLIEQAIRKLMLKREDIDYYLSFIKDKEKVQKILRENILDLIFYGEDISLYLPFLEDKTINEIKKEKEILKRGIYLRVIKNLDYTVYKTLCDTETLKESFEYIITQLIEKGVDFSSFLNEIDKESLEKIKNKYQIKIQEGAVECMISGGKGLDNYLNLIENTLSIQNVLKKGILRLIAMQKSDFVKYLPYLSKNNLEEIKERNKDSIKKIIENKLALGLDILPYLPLIKKETIDLIKNNKEKEKRLLFQLILSFFKDNLKDNPFGIKTEISREIDKLSKEEIDEMLFSRNLLPLGIKIHTEQNEILESSFEKTKGFKAHSMPETYVSNPIPNTKILELIFKVLYNKLQENTMYKKFKENAYFQVCVPERLPNEACGIATIAFLLTRKNILQYNNEIVTTNAGTLGVTIYDGGGSLVENYFVPRKNLTLPTPKFNGRTDILLCKEINDIKNAHFILSLLVHANYKNQELEFKEIGEKFIAEFKEILEKHGKINWLKNTFVKTYPFEKLETEKLGEFLIEITNYRNNINEKIKNYNKGIELYYLEKDKEIQREIILGLQKIKKEIDESLYMEINSLVRKYYNLVYKKDKLINILQYIK